MTKKELVDYFQYFSNSDPLCEGIERFLSENGNNVVFEKLKNDKRLNLNKVKLNQLLLHSGVSNMTFGFFKYYWLKFQENHPYNLEQLDFGSTVKKEDGNEKIIEKGGYIKDDIQKYYDFTSEHKEGNAKDSLINTVEHLRWGFLRVYTDSLLYFGNINNGFSAFSKMNYDELVSFFESKTSDTKEVIERGKCYEFNEIEKNDRYLISEAVCKNLDATDASKTVLKTKLIERFKEAQEKGRVPASVGLLLDENKTIYSTKNIKTVNSNQFKFSMEDSMSIEGIFDEQISSLSDIDRIIEPLYERFKDARTKALENTKLYLSIINDLDVYVATSMRSKQDFITMADNCYSIFHDAELKKMNLRYFDPTISAAEGHDDKGLIECLMVKCAKVLIYTSGDKDSYGKDAEAAMALSSGKPVIFFCTNDIRKHIAKNIHPLSKLIDFETGVANGAMITGDIQEVIVLLKRIFKNDMNYTLTKQKISIKNEDGEIIEKAYFKLKDKLTISTVRVQTSDLFLSKSFWSHYSRYIKN